MKLILANNQSDKFVSFYDELRQRSSEPFDYTGYESLLFIFDTAVRQPVTAINLDKAVSLSDYDGVYINGYLSTYELAATTAVACESLGVPFINTELASPPSLSKLSSYAKLAAAGVPIPFTIAGTKKALVSAVSYRERLDYPAVLKRADADRGLDNYMVGSAEEVIELLSPHDTRSLWVLQAFIPNDGFYRVGYHGNTPDFCIFRSLQERPDGNARKAHMYKPKGGGNASLIQISEVPEAILSASSRAMKAMGRQIGGVDCLYDAATGKASVLEVNYNPQLVTVDTFKEERIAAFLECLARKW